MVEIVEAINNLTGWVAVIAFILVFMLMFKNMGGRNDG